MKFLLFFMLTTFLFAQPLDYFMKLNSQRTGLSQEQISKAKNPFSKEVKSTSNVQTITPNTVKTQEFTLSAIINNKAKINGKWVKIGEEINGASLEKIFGNKAVLMDANKNLITLQIKKDNKLEIKIK
ncbi:MAG: hypothetical protein K5978_04715 [Campylobacter sp.]|nr:hypothetical protein [Campylobacter sp.]